MNAPQDSRAGADLPLEVPEADLAEQLTPADADRPVTEPPLPRTSIPPEVPEADAVEQATPARPEDDLVDDEPVVDVLTEADPADVAEQARGVRVSDDDDEE
jgi:hypothetical protein